MFDITGQKKWGIIGDGQLARMLALEAYPLGIRSVILTGDSSSPAGQVSPLIVRGHVESRDDLHALLSQVDGAVIESEFVNCDALEATGLASKVVPSLSVIRTLQNKLTQKKLLDSLAIPTSKFFERHITDNSAWLKTLSNTPLVIKFATFGYDGKGVHVLNGSSIADINAAEEFLLLAQKRRIDVYAEEFVATDKELAMTAVRRRDGEIKTWPLVISEQKNGICDRITGPAVGLGVDVKTEIEAKIICEKIGANLGIVGVFTVEFFLTKDQKLLVNEIAPRVHNSAHFSQNAGCVSQFENHWRAVLDLSLGTTETTAFFAMQNILGPAELTSKECAQAPTPSDLAQVHWYGKRGISPGRKLGHINGACHERSQKGEIINALQTTLARWTDTQRQIFSATPTPVSQPGGTKHES